MPIMEEGKLVWPLSIRIKSKEEREIGTFSQLRIDENGNIYGTVRITDKAIKDKFKHPFRATLTTDKLLVEL
jgi:hypothetical protein